VSADWLYIGIGILLLLLLVWMYRRQVRYVKDITTDKAATEVYGLSGVEKPKFGEKIVTPRERFRLTVERIREVVLEARQAVGDARLNDLNEDDRRLYLGYLCERAEAIAAETGVPVTGPLLVPVSAEASRVLGNGREDFVAGEKLLDALTDSASATEGRALAKAGAEAGNAAPEALAARLA
jgi:hypothetical protein